MNTHTHTPNWTHNATHSARGDCSCTTGDEPRTVSMSRESERDFGTPPNWAHNATHIDRGDCSQTRSDEQHTMIMSRDSERYFGTPPNWAHDATHSGRGGLLTHKKATDIIQRACPTNQNVISEPHRTGPTTQPTMLVVTVHAQEATDRTQRACLANQSVISGPHRTGPTTQPTLDVGGCSRRTSEHVSQIRT
jgi:hypothetical protein